MSKKRTKKISKNPVITVLVICLIVVICVVFIVKFLKGEHIYNGLESNSVSSYNSESFYSSNSNSVSSEEGKKDENEDLEGIDVEVIKEKELSIHFIELGNKYTGDCTLIKVGNTEVLIDAGSRADSVTPIYNYVSNYVTDGKLEYVIVTHAHQDHYAGFATGEKVESLLDKFNVETIIKFAKTNQKETATLYKNFNRELEETVEKNNTVVYDALQCYNETDEAQRIFSLGENVELEILYQKYYELSSSTENDYSVCCMINQKITETETKKYLFTGDLEKDGEKSLVESNSLSEVELYKAGHHGSKTSSSETLMSVIKPKIICVCCCAGSSEYTTTNENQFPTQQFVNNVAPYTFKVFVTTLCVDYKNGEFTSMNGNIVVYYDNGEVKVRCSNNGTYLKDTEWFKANRTCPSAWQTA